jgi:EpsI family protein
VFLTSLPAYLDVWSAQPYTHGYLIAIAVVWLVWRERDVFHESSGVRVPALLGTVGVSLMWLVATVAEARSVVLALVPLVLLAWAAAAFGGPAMRRLAPVAAMSLLAVPLWDVFTRPLQIMTIAVSGSAARLLGVPATISGNLVNVSSGTFAIEGGCAGLNYLMSGLTIGALYAQVLLRRWAPRLTVLGLAAGMAIVGNWIRVATLVMIGDATKMQSIFLSGRPHLVYGWSIFFLGLLVFFPLAGRVERHESRMGLRESVESEPASRSGPSARLGSWRVRPAAYATAAALLGPLLFVSVAALPTHDVRPFDLDEAPRWHEVAASVQRPYAWQPAFTGADERLQGAWSDGAAVVFSDRMLYMHESQGQELIGFRSRIAPEDDVVAQRLFGPVGRKHRLVNEAIVRSGDRYLLVWYWYRVGGVEAVEPMRAKLLEVWAFFSRRKVAELIAFSTPCGPDNCTDAVHTLSSFFGST